MRKFLIKIVLFLGLLTLIMGLCDVWISKTLAGSESFAMGDAKVWDDILEGKIDDEILIYGSSRAWRHFDPEFIEEQTGLTAYNLGVDGQAFDIQYLRHELHLKYNKPPKVIIYSIDVNTLGIPRGLYNEGQFLPFFYKDALFKTFTEDYVNFTFIDYNIPMLRYSGQKKVLTYFLKEVINWPQVKTRTKGFASYPGSWNADYSKARKKSNSYYKTVDESVVKRFDEFLSAAHAQGISVIFMYSPEHVLGQELVENRGEIVNLFESLADKHAILFLDYSKDAMNSNTAYFYNSLHLNSKGVAEFNKLYSADLKRYLDTICAH